MAENSRVAHLPYAHSLKRRETFVTSLFNSFILFKCCICDETFLTEKEAKDHLLDKVINQNKKQVWTQHQ